MGVGAAAKLLRVRGLAMQEGVPVGTGAMAALQAGNTALKGELAETQARLSSAVDLRAQRDSQIAQLRAEIEDAARQSEQQQNALDALLGQQREWDAARHRLETEIRDLRSL